MVRGWPTMAPITQKKTVSPNQRTLVNEGPTAKNDKANSFLQIIFLVLINLLHATLIELEEITKKKSLLT